MLYICIPTYNEAPTVGVLLWRIRKVFQGFSREYEILVYDDASTDGTSDALQPYSEVIPLTVIRGNERKGYAHAVSALAREVSRKTKYARRDGMLIMQADFTDQPEHIPELVKRFEGGVDIVIAQSDVHQAPVAVRRMYSIASRILRLFVKTGTVADPFRSYRLIRISVVRELLKSLGGQPLLTTEGWAADAELLLRAAKFARKIDTVSLPARYDLRTRETRVRPFPDAMRVFRFGRTARAAGLQMESGA
ncbi:MAG: glycosyltransferase family 2 protein [Gemmatimonadaceae bacterium]|nr:glycosyltransferase family 2 protein [Gemmatimonadaceae bacterium]